MGLDRVANAIDMKNDRTSQFLARNREQHVSEMMAAEINASQIQYKGWALGVSDQYQADRSKCEAECPQPYHWPFASVSCSFGNHRELPRDLLW